LEIMLRSIVVVLLFVAAAYASGATTPRYATQLESYSNDSRLDGDVMRLRVTVATDSHGSDHAVSIGDLLLCAKAECYRARTAGHVDINDTSAGTASVVADVVIPLVTVTDVFFTETVGGPALTGHLKLRAPLVMEKGFYGAELLIGLRKQQARGKSAYAPTQSASMFFNPESDLVHYLPAVQTVAKLPLGAMLTIPAGALAEPQVFHVGVSNVGERYPRIDIYPYVKLSRPGTIDVPPIPGGSSAHDMIVPVGTPAEESLWATPDGRPARNARIALPRTGVINEPVKYPCTTANGLILTQVVEYEKNFLM
jgi:hypothetical protein